MLPYGIIIKQNKMLTQQSFIVWQRKYGILKTSKLLSMSAPLIALFIVIYFAVSFFVTENFSILGFAINLIISLFLIISFIIPTAIRTIKEYGENIKEERVEIILREDVMEITTEFTKEVVPYSEIDCCYEKDFLITLMCDKNNFPVSISKMYFEKGSYDVFVSLLKSRIPNKYEKRGDN